MDRGKQEIAGDCRPIAVFDSGMGGLTVWRELRRLMPRESLIYYGDGKNCPYGSKPREEVTGYVEDAARFLIEDRGAKMLVVACNAATAVAIEHLRTKYKDIPIVGMEPAVKPAALSSQTGVIGILATANTLKGSLFHDTSERYGSRVRIIPAVGEDFVELVERGMEDSPEAEDAVRRAISPMLDAGADRIVLGCTHYPFLAQTMLRVIGDRDVRLIDPAPAVARRAESLLAASGSLCDGGSEVVMQFFTASDESYLDRLRLKAAEAPEIIL